MLPRATAFSACCLFSPLLSSADVHALEWQEPLVIASGHAYQGPWRMNESDFDYVDDPTVQMKRDGSLIVAWVDQSRKDVFLQRYDLEGTAQLPSPVNVSRSSDVFSWLPRVVVSEVRPAAVYVLWQEIIFSGGSHGGDILFARSTDGGRSFEAPSNLSRDRAGSGKGRLTRERWHNGSLDLAGASDGTLYATWTDYEGDLWFARSTDGGESFSQALEIAADGSRPARGPSLAVGEETVFLAWSTTAAGGGRIHLARSADRGVSFSRSRLAHRAEGHADAPKIVVDPAGALHLFVADGPGASLGNYHGYDVAYRRLDGWDDDFTEPVVLSERSGSVRGAGFPYASTGRAEELHVVWETFPPDASRPRGLGHTHSTDGGRTWSAPAPIPGSGDTGSGINGSLQGLLMHKLTANDSGNVAVVNSIFRHNEWSQVRLLRGSLAPRLTRSIDLVRTSSDRLQQVTCRAPSPARNPRICPSSDVRLKRGFCGSQRVRRVQDHTIRGAYSTI